MLALRHVLQWQYLFLIWARLKTNVFGLQTESIISICYQNLFTFIGMCFPLASLCLLAIDADGKLPEYFRVFKFSAVFNFRGYCIASTRNATQINCYVRWQCNNFLKLHCHRGWLKIARVASCTLGSNSLALLPKISTVLEISLTYTKR